MGWRPAGHAVMKAHEFRSNSTAAQDRSRLSYRRTSTALGDSGRSGLGTKTSIADGPLPKVLQRRQLAVKVHQLAVEAGADTAATGIGAVSATGWPRSRAFCA